MLLISKLSVISGVSAPPRLADFQGLLTAETLRRKSYAKKVFELGQYPDARCCALEKQTNLWNRFAARACVAL